MNRVYSSIFHGGRPWWDFSMHERVLIVASAVVSGCVVNRLFGVAAAVAVAMGLRLLCHADHRRFDHLALRLRHLARLRTTRLVDRDLTWKPFIQGGGV